MEYNSDIFYEHLVISGEDANFQNDLTKASIDGWIVEHINSFPVNKPDYIKNSVSVIVIYTAVLKRAVDRKELEKDDSREPEDESSTSMDR